MKHVKLYEEFDLDRFLDNPEKELADDNSNFLANLNNKYQR